MIDFEKYEEDVGIRIVTTDPDPLTTNPEDYTYSSSSPTAHRRHHYVWFSGDKHSFLKTPI